MKKIWKKMVVGILTAALFFCNDKVTMAVQITEQNTEQNVAQTAPSVMVTGEVEELENFREYDVFATEQEKEKIIVPVTVTCSGLVNYEIVNKCAMLTENSMSVSGSGITVGIYADEACTTCLEKTQVVSTAGVGELLYQDSFEAEKDAVYYLMLSVDEQWHTLDGLYA